MWRRKAFDWLPHRREKGAQWASQNPWAMIAAMFCVMVMGVGWLLARPEAPAPDFAHTAKLLYSGFDNRRQGLPVTADMLEMWTLYEKVQTVNPDSLSARDTALLKDIDQQLNRLIHE